MAQAFADAAWRPRWLDGDHLAHGEVAVERGRARAWLLDGGAGFDLACELAALDPACVRARARRLAAAGWPPVAHLGDGEGDGTGAFADAAWGDELADGDHAAAPAAGCSDHAGEIADADPMMMIFGAAPGGADAGP